MADYASHGRAERAAGYGDSFDVAVVGAGPAGSAAAWYLAREGLSVALLDRAAFPRDKTCGDGLTPRAINELDRLGILPAVTAEAFRCEGITIRGFDDRSFRLTLNTGDLPDYLLVVARLRFDEMLRAHAQRAGASFVERSNVRDITPTCTGRFEVAIEGRRPLDCRVAVVATGANSGLVSRMGLVDRSYSPGLAARAYFENVAGLDDTIVLLFDEIRLPGYGWVFPTSATTANVGIGAFYGKPRPEARDLQRLLGTHPYLQRVLEGARQAGPVKSFPLRTDFSPSRTGRGRVLLVGESAGLVNPITGEGIDYALESAHLAAVAVAAEWDSDQEDAILRTYRRTVSKRFRYHLALNHLARKLYFRNAVLPHLLRNAERRDYLRHAIVAACFGSTNPAILISPRTIWEIIRP